MAKDGPPVKPNIVRPPVVSRGTGKQKDVTVLNDNLDVTVTNEADVNVTNESFDVYIQDQTSDLLILPLAQLLATTALSAVAIVNGYVIVVDSVVGITVGDHIRIINAAHNAYYSGTVLNIDAGNVITLDYAIDYAYELGSEVTVSNINMAVDGSITPVHFHLRTGSPSVPSSIDITRLMMVCECSGAVDLNKFGDIIGGLERGLLFRHQTTDRIDNLFGLKKNSDLALLGYDWAAYSASHPNQGINGFAWRLTFNGQNKMGVAIRIDQFGQLGMIVQDDLTDLVNLTVVLEGHIVEY